MSQQDTAHHLIPDNLGPDDNYGDCQTQLSMGATTRFLNDLETRNSDKKAFRLPNEILHMIFIRTVTPYMMLDSSFGGPNSPFFNALRTRKGIVCVCRQWYIVGIEMLYEKVVFHRVGQIPALAHSLECNAGLGNLIRAMDIRCFVPSSYFTLFDHDLRLIFDQSPRLTQLFLNDFQNSANPLQTGIPSERIRSALSTRNKSGTLSRVTHLECGDTVDLGDLMALLRFCNELRFLALCLPCDDSSREPSSAARQLSLHSLLALRFTIKVSSGLRDLNLISAQWSMPALRCLSVYENACEIMGFHPADYLEGFIEKYGHNIKYLHFRRLVLNRPRNLDMQRILNSCPLLQHLVLDPYMQWTTPVTHPGIMWVDSWRSKDDRDLRVFTFFIPAAFPALRRIRLLDFELPAAVEWPLLLPPDPNMDRIAFEYPWLHIQADPDGIYKIDSVGADATSTILHCDVGDDEDASSFVDTSSESSSSDDSESSDELDVGSTEESAEWEEVDRETALSIFRRTVERVDFEN